MRFAVDANISPRVARHLCDKPDGLAALLLANLDAVAGDLDGGAVVTLTPRHLRVRPLPFRRAT